MKKILKKYGIQRFVGVCVLLVGLILVVLNNFVNTKNVLGALGVLMSIGGLYTWLIKCEKHQYLKLILGFILLSVILTWMIPGGYFSGTDMVDNGFTRTGLFDLCTYSLLGMYYFTVLAVFLFMIGGFYSVLNKTAGYKVIVHKIVAMLKGKENIFIYVSMFLYGVLTAFITSNLSVLIFVPFSIAIAYGLTKNKLLSFVSTFGGILIGIVGSVFSSEIAGILVSTFSIEYTNNILIKVILFVVAYALMVITTILFKKHHKNTKDDEKINELFVVEKPKANDKSIGVLICLIIFALITVVAFIPWSSAFSLNWATDLHTALSEFKLFNSTILSYILGTTSEFGTWDLFSLQALMIVFSVIIALVSRMKIDDFFDAVGNGLKNSGKYVVTLLLIYLVVEISVIFPVIAVVVDWLMSIFNGFSYILASISIIISSLFGVELQYATQMGASYLVTMFDGSVAAGTLSIMYQSLYGLVQFVAPTSVILMLGLTYLDIPYKKWLSFIWKFLVGMTIAIILILVFKVLVF